MVEMDLGDNATQNIKNNLRQWSCDVETFYSFIYNSFNFMY
jgi:hypothetical protein